MLRWKFCFDCQGIVYYDFIPEVKTVNKYTYIIRPLRDAVRRKCPEKWRNNSCFFLHNNAPAEKYVNSGESNMIF